MHQIFVGFPVITEHQIGLLKVYMQDLVEQARQESRVLRTAGYAERDYVPEEALMDLLALLDDRMIELDQPARGLGDSR